MGKFGKKNEINLDILSYNIALMGEGGCGKTTLIKQVCEKLAGDDGYIFFDMGFECGSDAIHGIVAETIEDWDKFVEVTDDIIENKETDYPNLRVVVIDTYDELYRLAEEEVIRMHNRRNPEKKTDTINSAFGGFGKGMDKAIEIMLERLFELRKVGVAFIVIAHTKKKDIDDVVTDEQYSILTSNVSQKVFNALKTKLHFCGLAYIDREIVKEKTGKKNIVTNKDITKGKVAGESRVISFRDDTYSLDSKSRFANIVDKIPLDADAFIKALQDAILAEHEKSGKPIKETEKKQAAEVKEQKAKVVEYSENRKKNKINPERNEELIIFIKNNLSEADKETREEVKKLLNGTAKLDKDTVPTAMLEEIVDLIKSSISLIEENE